MSSPPRLVLVLLLALALGGCASRSGDDDGAGPDGGRSGPVIGVKGDEPEAAADLGFPGFATKNTTRVAGADPTAVAAAVSRAVFPGPSAGPRGRPRAVALVPRNDWRAALAASVLMADPTRAPLLLSDPESLPQASADALEALRPTGADDAGDAQVIRVGRVARPAGLRTTDVPAANPFATARAIDALHSAARGAPSDRVLVVSADAPGFAMPAAAWAAKGGDPILFVQRDRVPPETLAALRTHRQPRIYVLGPSTVVRPSVTRRLRRLGTVERVGGREPVTNAISFARYLDGAFGWGVVDPGHGLVFAAGEDPLLAAAAAPLSASGTYGPLLLTGGRANRLDERLREYLLDIQPGFERDPVRGVYNHGWIIGDERAVSIGVQARIDALLEITRVSTAPAPPPTTPPTPAQTQTTTTATTPAP